MIKLDKDKVQVRYITGINKCLPGYPTPLDVLYESCVESADGNLFSEAKMENKYGLDEDSVSKIIESLVSLEYIKKNNTRYKIIKTPWDLLKTTIDQEKLIFAYALKKPQYLLSMGGDFYNNPEIQYLANNAKLFFQEYKESPSCEQMKSIIKGDKKELSPEIVDSIYDVEINAYDDDFLKDTTEGWILFRSLNHNLFEAVTLVKTTDVTLENVRDVVRRAATCVADTNLISFDRDLGDDFWDPESHRNIKGDKIPSTWEYWNKVSHGGLDHKTLTCYIGGTNVGKCCQYDTKIKVRNKKTGEVKEISIGDFFNQSQH